MASDQRAGEDMDLDDADWHLPPSAAVSLWRRELLVTTDGPLLPFTVQVIEVSPSTFAVAHCDPAPTQGQVAWGCAHCQGFHPVTMPMCPHDPRAALADTAQAPTSDADESDTLVPNSTVDADSAD